MIKVGRMMKIILSRKGFDSRFGSQPSPILPDGTLLSLPIPSKNDDLKFTDLHYQDKSYYELIKELKPDCKIKENYTCHLDPDIKRNVIKREPSWRGLFGQTGRAQGHLHNENIGLNDIFLFFGWFKETKQTDVGLRYVKNAPNLHIIYGYFQVKNIYKSYQDLPVYSKYHSHADRFLTDKNNCIYSANTSLSFNNRVSGFGCLTYNKSLVLTKQGEPKSHWDLPDFFREARISYHSKSSFKQDYFQSAKIGQEFVVEEDNNVINWAQNIIIRNKRQG